MKHIGEILFETNPRLTDRLPGFGVPSSAPVVAAPVAVASGAAGVAACLQDGAPAALSPSVTRGQQPVGGAQ